MTPRGQPTRAPARGCHTGRLPRPRHTHRRDGNAAGVLGPLSAAARRSPPTTSGGARTSLSRGRPGGGSLGLTPDAALTCSLPSSDPAYLRGHEGPRGAEQARGRPGAAGPLQPRGAFPGGSPLPAVHGARPPDKLASRLCRVSLRVAASLHRRRIAARAAASRKASLQILRGFRGRLRDLGSNLGRFQA